MSNKRYMTLKEMAKIQDELNEYTTENWRVNLNSNDFKTAMFAEFAELLESAPYKWWKHSDTPADVWNLKIEAIDILHFALSIYICDNTVETSADLVLGMYNKPDAYMINNDKMDRNVFINKACSVLTSSNPIVMDDFFDSLGLLAEEVAAIYTVKSELNYIRQDEGYKNGTYVKISDGIEDNVKLEGIVDKYLTDTGMSLVELRALVRETLYEQAETEKEVQIEEEHY